MHGWPRVVLHADMDAFYAAVEQRDDPALRGRPVIIGWPSKRGVVSTASYEARPFGVRSAMPMVEAMRRCPQAAIVPPRFERYAEVSRTIMGVFGDFSPQVEPLSLDEAFLEMTGAEGLFGEPEQMAQRLRAAVREATAGLTVSVGAACTKFLAKIASDFHKPNGQTVVPPERSLEFLWPLPVARLWGAGPKTVERLTGLGLHTIGDVARADVRHLEQRLGSAGRHFHALANNDDPRAVVPGREAKSIGSERTLEEDIVGAVAVLPHLRRASEEVAVRLRAERTTARGVRVKLKTHDHRLLSRQAHLRAPSDVAVDLYQAAVELLAHFELGTPMRLVGLTAFDLTEPRDAVQLELFGAPAKARRRSLETTLDAVRERFGSGALRRGEHAPEGPNSDGLRAPPKRPT